MHPYIGNLTHTNVAIATGLITVLSAFGFYVYHKKTKKDNPPTVWEQVGQVTNLYLYPLKSGRRIPVNKADCTEIGLRQCKDDEKVFQLQDRSFVVYGEGNNEFKTARTYPKMILIEVSVHDDQHVQFDAPGQRPLYVKLPSQAKDEKTTVIMRGEKIEGSDCGNEAATWLSRYLLDKDEGMRLAFFDPDYRRDVNVSYSKFLKVYPNLGSKSMGRFTDLGSCLLMNEASMRDLNYKIPNSKITHEYFRPNIVVDGINGIPFAEDEWDWIKIGDVTFRKVLPCTRCILTTIDPNTGVKTEDREPLKTLETYRLHSNPAERELKPTSPKLGIHMGVISPGLLSVSDKVYIGIK